MPNPISAAIYDKQSADTKYSWILNKISSANLPQDCSIDTDLQDGNREIRYHLMKSGKRLTTLIVEHISKTMDSQRNEVEVAQQETANDIKNQIVIDKWLAEVKQCFNL